MIHASWQTVKDGQYEAFQQQNLVQDPLGFWGLQFYETLFELHPELKSLFQNTFVQSVMLTEMVDTALQLLPGTVDQLLREEKTEVDPALIPALQELAERHVSYNVKAEHYGPVGLAVVMTLEKTLGPLFNEQTKTAWVELWSLICSVMIPAHVKKAQEMGVEI